MSFIDFVGVSEDFHKFHQNPVNVALHLLTSPLGVLGFFSLVLRASGGVGGSLNALVAVYLLSLAPILAVETLVVTAVLTVVLANQARALRLSWLASAVVLACGYFGQDLSHYVTGEQTYQSTYEGDITGNFGHFATMATEHVYLLLPLVLDSAARVFCPTTFANNQHYLFSEGNNTLALYLFAPLTFLVVGLYCCDGHNRFLPIQYPKGRVVDGKFVSQGDVQDLGDIREWVMEKGPSDVTSSHWWYRDLTGNVRTAFERLATSDCMLAAYRKVFPESSDFVVEPLWGMNEIYVSAPAAREDRKGTSDEVFYTEHIDGPFALFPWTSCYRTIVALDNNTEFSTHYSLMQSSYTAANGDFVAFDFNREPHFITQDRERRNESHRVVLKLHYCMYRRGPLALLGKLLCFLNVKYNQLFRALFLATIAPKSALNKAFSAYGVVFGTKLVNSVEMFVGYDNLAYLVAVCVLSYALNSYTLLLVATSFVHYFQYITLYYYRCNVRYGAFKRDSLLFKTLALIHLIGLYAWGMFPEPDWVGIGLAAVGYTLSGLATLRLGINGTYFGIELGFVHKQKNFVQTFPYGVVPHPMILGQIIALIGLGRAAYLPGFLVPAHIALYTVHMIQEEFDIFNKQTAPAIKQD
eukprot:m.155579 g.155579  ORF g.155579 m.155579 type:complete len:639 (-) comp17535_c1_seq1:32-1948(-)